MSPDAIAPTPPLPTVPRGRQLMTLAVAAVGSFLMPFMASSINVALPAIGQEFSLGAVLLSWVATSYLLATALFLLPFGRLADLHGRNRFYVAGMALYALASLASGLAESPAWLLAARAVQGVGASMMVGTSMALVTAVFSPQERGWALGYMVSAVYVGLSVGPFFGGFCTHHFGWRSLFWVNCGLGLLGALFSAAFLPAEPRARERAPFDLAGSLLLGLSILALMLGLGRLPSWLGLGLLVGGLVGFGLFGALEWRRRHPVLDVRLLVGNRIFLCSSLAALLNYMSTVGVGFLLSLYLQHALRLDAQQAGLVLVAQPVVMALLSPLAGRLSDRHEPRRVASFGMALTVIGLLLLSLLGEDSSPWTVVAILLLLGLGFALFSSPNTHAVMAAVDRRMYGVASALLGSMRLLGQMLSMGLAMLILSLYLGQAKVTPELTLPFVHAMKITLLLLALLCLGGIFASLARGRLRG